jgi:type I restriction enzyme S subunit
MMAATKNTKAFYNTEIPSDWEVKRLEEVFKLTSGKTKSNELFDKPIDGSIYPVFGGNGIMGFASEFNSEGENILIGRVGEYCGITRFVDEKCWITDNALYSKEYLINIDKKYLAYKLQLEDLSRLRNKGGQPLISQGPINIHKVSLPKSLPEQKAIAQVLGTADAAIHTTEKLITQKELRKKWLMQQLLTGKKRLMGFEDTKWKIQPLENFIKPIVREVPKPSTPYLGIGLRSHGKGTFLKHDEQPEKNSMDNFYVVRQNDLIVNITFAWEQAIAIVRPEDDGALASHRFPTYTFVEDKGHPDFFRFYILKPRMKSMLQIISPGGAGRNRVMSKSDFIKLEFLLPEYEEQTAIAQVLQAADKEISLLKAKAEKLREQKKGLMQVLLTGKVRLKIN